MTTPATDAEIAVFKRKLAAGYGHQIDFEDIQALIARIEADAKVIEQQEQWLCKAIEIARRGPYWSQILEMPRLP